MSAATLQGIDILAEEQVTHVAIRLDDRVRYQYGYLPANGPAPARCYIDLHDTVPGNTLTELASVADRNVARIRIGIYPAKLRVVLDLSRESSCSVPPSTMEPFGVQLSVGQIGDIPPVHVAAAGPSSSIMTTQSTAGAQPADDEPGPEARAVPSDPQSVPFNPAESLEESGLSPWGWVKFYAASDLGGRDAEDRGFYRLQGRVGVDSGAGSRQENSTVVRVSLDYDRIFYDAEEADDGADLDLHEAYLQINRAGWDFSFGKQRVRWGKSDQLSPVDSLNPRDLRQFVTLDLEETTIPSWLLRSRWFGADMDLEFVVQPWFEKSRLEYFDSNWAIYRNLRQLLISDPMVPDGLKDYARDLRVSERVPGRSLENLSGAARLKWRTPQTDFAASVRLGWETVPTIASFPVKNVDYPGDPGVNLLPLLQDAVFTDEQVVSEYHRQQVYGFEWETVAFEPFGFRGEIAHLEEVAFLGRDLTSRRRPVTHLVAGVDYTSENEWYFNVQGSWQRIHGYSDDILYFSGDTVAVLGEIRKPAWRGNLELATRYIYMITDRSSYLRPSVTLMYFANLEFEIGANLFSGDGETLFGSYARADQVYGLLKCSF